MINYVYTLIIHELGVIVIAEGNIKSIVSCLELEGTGQNSNSDIVVFNKPPKLPESVFHHQISQNVLTVVLFHC